MSDDPLSLQVSIKVTKPKGLELSKKFLNEAYLHWVKEGEFPQFPGKMSMEIRGIFWKNSARKGKLNYWRWSSHSDLSVLIPGYKQMTPEQKQRARERNGVESEPRGDHEEARTTLQGALAYFRPF